MALPQEAELHLKGHDRVAWLANDSPRHLK
jgi:hypothetical protein